METLGERLKELRGKRNLLQKEVAGDLNILAQTYSRYENDLRYPNIEQLIKIAEYYNVSTDYLLGIDKTYIDKNKTLQYLENLEQQILNFKNYIKNCK